MGLSKWAYICIQPTKPHVFRLMSSPICLLYRVIQDFVQKALKKNKKTKNKKQNKTKKKQAIKIHAN